ncbi:MAG: FGGY-family carbohydrate kinase [Steroidobacteraceae bacterium]|nr:FGGY-family carbohydrate kinase [Steroidobacteraceae bacterium]
MTVASPCVLAIDLGTSGPKAAVVSLQGELLATARRPVETLHLPDGGVEQDPEAIWRATREACVAALRSCPVSAAEVLAVICTSQYSSIIPVDQHGRPTANMVTWLDKRGATPRLRALPGFPRCADSPPQLLNWLRLHGLPPVAGGISLTHLRHFRFARPEVYERTAKFLEPMDYLTLRLTGRATANQCTAFMYLMTDNRRLGVTDYHPGLLRQSLIDREKLPELVPVDAIVGTLQPSVASELGLAPGTKVVTGLNDTQAGGMGTAAFAGDHAAISIGSTSVMITHVPCKRTDLRHAILSLPSPVPETYFVMAENGTGGNTLEHFLERLVYTGDAFGQLSAADRFELLQRAVGEAQAGSGGVLFLPWLGGSMAPAADDRMRGGFLNIGLATRRSELARAVLEGVAMNLRWLRGPVERFAKRRCSHFVFYGGGAASAAWAQILADVLDAPVHQARDPQYVTCRGAALLAFQRLGLLGFDEFGSRVPIERRFDPNPAHRALYDHLSARFVDAFRRTRPVFHALNRPEAAA